MSAEQDDPPPGERGTHRIEGFSDGYFAIVITLLAIELRIPPEEDARLLAALRDLWPVGLSYLVAFVNIYILWVSHHELMRLVRRADTKFLYMNGALLLGVAVIPFGASLVSEFLETDDGRLAVALFTGALLWVAMWFNLIWFYLATHPDLLLLRIKRGDRRRIVRTYLVTLALYGCAFVLSWVAPFVSLLIALGLAIFFAVADRLSGFASEDLASDDPKPDSGQS